MARNDTFISRYTNTIYLHELSFPWYLSQTHMDSTTVVILVMMCVCERYEGNKGPLAMQLIKKRMFFFTSRDEGIIPGHQVWHCLWEVSKERRPISQLTKDLEMTVSFQTIKDAYSGTVQAWNDTLASRCTNAIFLFISLQMGFLSLDTAHTHTWTVSL